ncbi:MAG: DNA translocase FtsK, partial [Phocaeicola sp.]
TDIPAFFRKQEQVSDFKEASVQEETFENAQAQETIYSESIETHEREDSNPTAIEDNAPSEEENQYVVTAEAEQESIVEIVTELNNDEGIENVASINETYEETTTIDTYEEIATNDAYEETAAAIEMTISTEEMAEPVVQESPIQIEETEQVAPTVREERKRKHIPFNVVMLRQDRERIQKQQSKIVEKKTEEIEVVSVSEEVPALEENEQQESQSLPYYQFPSIEILSPTIKAENDDDWLNQQGRILNETLLNFNVRASVVNITQGPAVTQFEIQPEPGVKVNKVTNLADDIKLCLAAQDIRMEAPIPGKHTIGIEIPNRKSRPVFLREILESNAFIENESPLTVALGLDITGEPIVTDLRKMPHGLIAGATGSGKSVCINSMLVSLLYKATPQEVKLLLIDPKMVELAPYNHIPHLVSPVITDVKAATAALKWAVEEMERRYELFAHTGVRDIGRFNNKAKEAGQLADQLPYIVIIIDELADLMMMSPAEVEESICRIAQKARACGIHLLVATQRPSVDVITGLIKANIPTRIA